ncbi:MAG: sel1 repeat family protein [Methylobacteriaceae bacterium]|jgi:TPR repeat protein|nr:sel1 repeat family protein [Methylobacteriaceae bacterium]
MINPLMLLRIFFVLGISLAVCAPGFADVESGLAALQDGDSATAEKELRPPAEQGDSQAQYYLGAVLIIRVVENAPDGDGAQTPEGKEAISWLEKSANQGEEEAQLMLSDIYFGELEGMGGAVDTAKGMDWMLKAAESGSATGQYYAGSRYYEGAEGMEPDCAKALDWLEKAAAQEAVGAEMKLWEYFSEGHCGAPDYPKGIEWLTRAADREDSAAQYMLGEIYLLGIGVPIDDAKGFAWMRKARDLGSAEAEDILALYGKE